VGFLNLRQPLNGSSEDLISVIIPTRDRPVQLLRALKSVLSQTHRPVEIIVVDDGSQEPTAQLLTQHFGQDVICCRNETPAGAAVARNVGLRVATGHFVAFLDDDDTWLPNKLSSQFDEMERSLEKPSMVGCGFSYVYEGHEVAIRDYFPSHNFYEKLLTQNFIGGCSVPLIRTEALRRIGGFDEGFPSCQDWELWLRLARIGPVGFVPASLVRREIHGDQITADVRRKISGREMLLAKFQTDLKAHPRALGEHMRRLGTLCLLNEDNIKARKYYRNALDCLGFDWSAIIGVLISWWPTLVAQSVARKFAASKIGHITFYH